MCQSVGYVCQYVLARASAVRTQLTLKSCVRCMYARPFCWGVCVFVCAPVSWRPAGSSGWSAVLQAGRGQEHVWHRVLLSLQHRRRKEAFCCLLFRLVGEYLLK